MISITNFQAGFGDTFLVEILSSHKKDVRILIDCGFEFEANVIPTLSKIGEQGGKIDRFIITHFDSDHIASASKFLIANGSAAEGKIIPIDQIWLNTFRHLQFSKRSQSDLTRREIMILSAFNSDLTTNLQSSLADKTISAKQCIMLGAEILKSKYKWNSDFEGQAASIDAIPDIMIGSDVHIHLLSPNITSLNALEKKFISELNKMKIPITDNNITDDAFELYARWLDKQEVKEKSISGNSETITEERIIELTNQDNYEKDSAVGNGSSISFIFQAEGKQLLFLADSHAEDVIEQIRLRYTDQSKYPILFKAIKVAHHGSFKNNKPELYEIIDGERFIFSTNGKHPKHVHPDVETIIHIINRPLPEGILHRKLYFNHDLEHLKFLKDEFLQERFKFKISFELSLSI